jgi:hypothetical protein
MKRDQLVQLKRCALLSLKSIENSKSLSELESSQQELHSAFGSQIRSCLPSSTNIRLREWFQQFNPFQDVKRQSVDATLESLDLKLVSDFAQHLAQVRSGCHKSVFELTQGYFAFQEIDMS